MCIRDSIYSWDFIDGYTNNPNNEGFAKRNPVQALELVERLTAQTPALFLLKDFIIAVYNISHREKCQRLIPSYCRAKKVSQSQN